MTLAGVTFFVAASILIVLFVDRRFWNYWFMWPLAVTFIFVRYFLTVVLVISGHVVKNPLFISLIHVDMVGDIMHR